MKTVKVILGIVIAFSVVFFATGLFVKEIKYTTEVTINKPIEEVFKVYTDNTKYKKWIPEMVSIAPLETKEGVIGNSWVMIVNSGGKEIKIIQKILAFIPNKKLTTTFDSKDIFKLDECQFSGIGNLTKIQKTTTLRNKSYIMACVFPYFKGKLQAQDQRYLDQFKEIVAP